jgi:hypothetical protein
MSHDTLNDAILDSSSPSIRQINTKVTPLYSAHKKNQVISSPLSISALSISSTTRNRSVSQNIIQNISQLNDIALIRSSPIRAKEKPKKRKLLKKYFEVTSRHKLRPKENLVQLINVKLAIHLQDYGKFIPV